MSRVRSESGFTLMEVLVAILLSGVVFGATLTALEAFQKSNRIDVLRNEASDNARNTTDALSRQLRNAAAPSTGYFGALEEAEPYSIAFDTIDPQPKVSANTGNLMRLRYCLDDTQPTNETIWVQTKRWTTEKPEPESAPSGTKCPDLKAGDWETTRRLMTYVVNRIGGQNRPLFTYGPAEVAAVSKITTVEPHIDIDVDPGQKPGETTQNTVIEMRNANRQPVATFTATEANGFVLLDASASEDPDGLALTYKWWQDGKELSTTAEKYETGPKAFASGSVHVFTLEVTDPGGLTNTVTHEIKIK
jgi:prepilin-type N-terminal cleavage/methylation domain-containing protein